MDTTSFTTVLRRHAAQQSGFSHLLAVVLVVLLTLLILALLLIAGLLFMRQRRRSRKHELLPLYADKRVSTSSTSSHRRVLVRPSESIYLYHEKPGHAASSSDPPSPTSELPEIRITFPEEYDASGKRQSGRVVVVRVGDTGVGLEPVAEDLPAYDTGERFQSLDLDRIGGLVEKSRGTPQRLS